MDNSPAPSTGATPGSSRDYQSEEEDRRTVINDNDRDETPNTPVPRPSRTRGPRRSMGPEDWARVYNGNQETLIGINDWMEVFMMEHDRLEGDILLFQALEDAEKVPNFERLVKHEGDRRIMLTFAYFLRERGVYVPPTRKRDMTAL